MPPKRPFLSASWTNLAMLNYHIDPDVLAPLVPAGTQLDLFQGKAFVSMVGFMFERTRVCGLCVPFHTTFEEVNLRFYVSRAAGNEVRRGVVFVREIVPRITIALTANLLYGERYSAHPMRHQISADRVSYEWKHRGAWNRLSVEADGALQQLEPGSEEEFIAEHYWGYTARGPSRTSEYEVRHPPWRVRPVRKAVLNCNALDLYGEAFAPVLAKPPASAFLAEGSGVEVYPGEHILISSRS